MESHFGESSPLSLGVEEELMILDAETFAQVPAVELLVRESEKLELPGRLKTELFASVVELNTNPCESAPEALDSLRRLRSAAAEIAGRHGLLVAAAGTHPLSVPEEQEIVDEPRYRDFVAYAQVSARRQGVQGLHVHVGMPDADACLRVLESVLPWLPLVLALSVNSPYLAGVETGLASNRAEILGQLPRHGAPPVFGSFEGWLAVVDRMKGLGLARDYTALWWDARPHPRFGTLELRMPDQPTRVERSGAFVALLQALCGTLLDRADGVQPADRTLYEESRWAAAHYGLRAALPDAGGDRLAGVPELTAELLELVEPAARRLGTSDLLAELDSSSSEGDRQLQIGAENGLDAVCADLVERSIGSA